MKGSVLKRKSGWLLKWDTGKDAEGKRQVSYKMVNGQKKDAEAELTKILNSMINGTFVRPKATTVAEYLRAWLTDDAKPNVSPKTFERYEELIVKHMIPYIGRVEVQKLSAEHIKRLFTTLRTEGFKPRQQKKADGTLSEPKPARGLSEQTIKHVFRLLSNSLNEAARTNIIQRNPCKVMKAPKVNKKNKDARTMQILEKPRLATLFREFKGHWLFPIVSVAAGTGARRGEILALRWTDIDFDKGLIHINKATEETKAGVRIMPEPKNESSVRSVGIDSGLISVLRGLRKDQLEKQFSLTGKRLPPDALVFPGSPLTPSKPYRPSNVSSAHRDMVKKLGFKGFRFHDWRHNHAVHLLNAGIPVKTVSMRLGHSTATQTLDRYGDVVLSHSNDDAVKVAGALLNGVLG